MDSISSVTSHRARLSPRSSLSKKIAAVAPDIFLRVLFTDFPQKPGQYPLVLRFKRLATKEGQAVYIRRRERPEDLRFGLLCIFFSIMKIPGVLIETARAVMGTAGNEEETLTPSPLAISHFLISP